MPKLIECPECRAEVPSFARGLCKRCYSRLQKQGNLHRHPTQARHALSWLAMVDRSDPSSCWPWPGAIDRQGYGTVRGRKGTQGAHRFVYEHLMQTTLESHEVLDHLCHKTTSCNGGPSCPHRRCVNPMHLVVTTNSGNVRRSFSERPTCRHGHTRTPENTAWIRAARSHGGLRRTCQDCRARSKRNGQPVNTTIPLSRVFELRDRGWLQREIAAELGISQPYVSELLSGRKRVS